MVTRTVHPSDETVKIFTAPLAPQGIVRRGRLEGGRSHTYKSVKHKNPKLSLTSDSPPNPTLLDKHFYGSNQFMCVKP